MNDTAPPPAGLDPDETVPEDRIRPDDGRPSPFRRRRDDRELPAPDGDPRQAGLVVLVTDDGLRLETRNDDGAVIAEIVVSAGYRLTVDRHGASVSPMLVPGRSPYIGAADEPGAAVG